MRGEFIIQSPPRESGGGREDRMFYAKFDRTVRQSNPGFGFCNTKTALAFRTRRERDAFVAERESYDFSTSAITRAEAMRMLERVYDHPYDKGLYLNQHGLGQMVVLRSSMQGDYSIGQIV
jgi:hypothetical protein